ncbi:unnamed protein product [Heligmosomoides polygyrus]|uniref:Uncharacterized protein n=1 Tax=Heligmosomoides polygyrus TaxID=6339 RepID=A0A183FDR0_HELPZ|nr:unnamed protein product [Heligmosomoides polygyrus]
MDSLLLLCRVDAFLVRGSGMFMHSDLIPLPNRTSATEAMWFRASFDCVHRVCPNIDYDDEEVEAFDVELEKF